jgi:hypothetical protein
MARSTHDEERMIAQLRGALFLDPDYLPALLTLADVQLTRGDAAQAQALFGRAVRLLNDVEDERHIELLDMQAGAARRWAHQGWRDAGGDDSNGGL